MLVHLGSHRPPEEGRTPREAHTDRVLWKGACQLQGKQNLCSCLHATNPDGPLGPGRPMQTGRLPWQGACLATRHLGRTQISPTCRHFALSFCCCTFCRVQASVSNNTLTWPVVFSCLLLQVVSNIDVSVSE